MKYKNLKNIIIVSKSKINFFLDSDMTMPNFNM